MTQKVSISERVLFARVSRKLLDKQNIVLKKCRVDSEDFSMLGRYYTVNLMTNTIEATHVDLKAWADKMELLSPFEKFD